MYFRVNLYQWKMPKIAKYLLFYSLILSFFKLFGQEIDKNKPQVNLIQFTECQTNINGELAVSYIEFNHFDKEVTRLKIGAKLYCFDNLRPSLIFAGDTLYIDIIDKHSYVDTAGNTIVALAECYCFYYFEWEILELNNPINSIYLNNEQIFERKNPYLTKPIQYELYQGDTINKTNIYGFKEGPWLIKDSTGNWNPYHKYYYSGDAFNFKPYKSVKYDQLGNIQYKRVKDSTFFYENGQLASCTVFVRNDKRYFEEIFYDTDGEITKICFNKNYNFLQESDTCIFYP